ncbi:hypothetical protein BO78DRAFT_101565 [Aspergillus sclerotiicarbonarius CBS 121057]|uniref:Uncharacterized protein n=1 Tax=Aspergillus sclerotiicarbonarius (strain CBS 121057 / IBT 28362) TaxID=1448318 RepID=A0A319ERC6_ASPSB|nr:hypothetical protein BO78DRAFT_101565 [Aspergillus sclerotiicarbonarius CBS 121057]
MAAFLGGCTDVTTVYSKHNYFVPFFLSLYKRREGILIFAFGFLFLMREATSTFGSTCKFWNNTRTLAWPKRGL